MEITNTLLYILIGILSIVFYFLRKNLNYWKDLGVPYDEPHFIYGSMRGYRQYRTLRTINFDIYKKFKGTGPFCGFHFYMRPAAFILDPTLAKEILIKRFSSFMDRAQYCNERDDPLSGHLIGLSGNKWKQLRKKLTPTFTSGKMKFMFPTIAAVGQRFIDVFDSFVSKSDIIEIMDLCARFTTDVIGTCAFGIECNSLNDPNAEFRLMGERAINKSRYGALGKGLMENFPNLARKLHMRRITNDVHEFFMRIVKETVDLREKNGIKRNDFMDLLLQLKNTKVIKTEDGEELKGLTIEEVAAQAFIFFVAGFDTSSKTMMFALYELACHQDIQEKARREINDVFAKHQNQFTYDYLTDLVYLNQIICETLRMHPIVSSLQRVAANDFIVPGNPNYRIKKGTLVIIPMASFHFDPEMHADPEEFKPERFSQEEVLSKDSARWMPFGDGPRKCIGKRFADMQLLVGLSLLLKNFKFSTCDRTPIPMEYDATSLLLTAKGGLLLRVETVEKCPAQ